MGPIIICKVFPVEYRRVLIGNVQKRTAFIHLTIIIIIIQRCRNMILKPWMVSTVYRKVWKFESGGLNIPIKRSTYPSYLIFEISIWINQVRPTRFLVYYQLDFYCLCSLHKSISKFQKDISHCLYLFLNGKRHGRSFRW